MRSGSVVMAARHVVVTLTPVYLPDTLPFRTLTLVEDGDCISVGRASKSESKQLIPAHNNAWFDSRVMSRNHADICASFEEKRVLVSDNGSMHGTFINDEQIPLDEEIEIKSGDVLTFGNEVTRWPKDGRPRDPSNPFALDTFPPLKVRCECQWFDDCADKDVDQEESSPEISKNSFSVPEEDDEEADVEVIPESLPAKPRVFSPIHFTIPSSEGSDDDSSDGGQDPKSSPPTSHPDENKERAISIDGNDAEPEALINEENEEDARQSTSVPPVEHEPRNDAPAVTSEDGRASRLGSQEHPINVEEGLSTAHLYEGMEDEDNYSLSDLSVYGAGSTDSGQIMPVSLANYAEAVRNAHEHFFEEPTSEQENRSTSEGCFKTHDVQPSTPESFSVSHEQPRVESENDNDSEEGGQNLGEHGYNSSFSGSLPASKRMTQQEAVDRAYLAMKHAQAQPFTGNPVPANCDFDVLRSPIFGGNDRLHAREPSPSDKALAKPLDSVDSLASRPPVPSTTRSPSPPFSRSRYDILPGQTKSDNLDPFKSFNPPTSRPYGDGPFMTHREREHEGPTPPRGFAHISNLPSFDSITARPPSPRQRQFNEDVDRLHDHIRALHHERLHAAPRVSVSDIVAESNREFNMRDLGKRLKRKASEMEDEPARNIRENGSEDDTKDGNDIGESLGLSDSIPDAQPQNVVEENIHSISQLTEQSMPKVTEEDTETLNEQPPRKRMKMTTASTNASRPSGNFTKYAATALAGAVVGGVGAIAALVALPPEFFT